MKRIFLMLFTAGLLATTLHSCRETTGDKVEDAADDVGDAVEDAVDQSLHYIKFKKSVPIVQIFFCFQYSDKFEKNLNSATLTGVKA